MSIRVGLVPQMGKIQRQPDQGDAGGKLKQVQRAFETHSQGVLEIDDRLLSEPDRGRGAMGFYRHEGATRSIFGRLSFQGQVILNFLSK